MVAYKMGSIEKRLKYRKAYEKDEMINSSRCHLVSFKPEKQACNKKCSGYSYGSKKRNSIQGIKWIFSLSHNAF